MVVNHMTCSRENNLLTRTGSNAHSLATRNGLIRTEFFAAHFLKVVFSVSHYDVKRVDKIIQQIRKTFIIINKPIFEILFSSLVMSYI